VEKRYIL